MSFAQTHLDEEEMMQEIESRPDHSLLGDMLLTKNIPTLDETTDPVVMVLQSRTILHETVPRIIRLLLQDLEVTDQMTELEKEALAIDLHSSRLNLYQEQLIQIMAD